MATGERVGRDTSVDVSGRVVTSTGSTTARTLAARFADVVNVRDFGAVGDGTTDDTAAIQAAITAAIGRRLYFPTPPVRFRVTSLVAVSSGTEVMAASPGLVEIQVPAGSSFPVFDVDGKSRVRVSGFRFTKAAGAVTTGESAGVRVRGASTDVVVENCHGSGFVSSFKVAGQDGTTPGTARRVSFIRCRADDSPSLWGFHVDDADGVLFDDCHATGNWLDGFKLRKKTLNVTVRGGSATGNGIGYLTNPALYAGDGLDAYAGGDTFLLDGFVVESNYGSGLTIKTGELTETEAADYGYVRNVQLANVRARNNLQGPGLYITNNNPGTTTEPIVNAVTIQGGVFEGNATYGMYVGCRNFSIAGPLVRDNQQIGIVVTTRAMDGEIVAPVVIANGRAAANTYDGINIQGARIRVRGGVFVGADAPAVAVDGDYAALTKYQRHAILVASTASDVEIDVGAFSNHASSLPVRVDMTSGRCLIRQAGAGLPTTNGRGSIGSTWTRTDATQPADVVWVKTSGNPNGTTGWQRAVDAGQSVLTRGDASLAIDMGSARTIVWTAPLTADRDASLPTTNLYTGPTFRIVRQAAATGAFNLNVKDQGGATLKALGAGQWADAEYTGSAWILVATGSL